MVNKVILIGNVGMDPEVRTVEGGAKVARVRLATTERLYDRQSGETKEHTEWHTITLWRGLADVVDRYVRKGSQIYVEGRLRTREWMDKDNNKRYTTEILADTMNLLGRRSDNPASDVSRQSGFQQGGYQQGGYQQSGAQTGGAPSGGYSQGGYQQGGYQSAPQAGGYPGSMPGGAASGGYQQPQPAQQPAQQPAPQTPADDPDDLPF